jgi:hydrogenase expression/formation protein HypC
MCLGIAGRVIAFDAARPGVARVEVQGVVRDVDVTLIDEQLEPGDWVLVHLGFAMERVTPEQAGEWLAVFEQLASEAS